MVRRQLLSLSYFWLQGLWPHNPLDLSLRLPGMAHGVMAKPPQSAELLFQGQWQ